jgi:hypothetical protein
MGFDWHRQCLKCEECNKVLNPGQHAEVREYFDSYRAKLNKVPMYLMFISLGII